MNILVTGATSFIGKHLVQALLENGDSVDAVVRRGCAASRLPKNADGLRIIELDMDEYCELGKAAGAGWDAFVHLAWNGTRGTSRNDAGLQKRNFDHSVVALRSVLDSGCRLVLTAGSQAQYGPSDDPLAETSPCRPNTEYGVWKCRLFEEAERLCARSGVDLKEPRFFSLYGPGDFAGTMIISMVGSMIAGEPCRLTRGEQYWDFLHIGDAIQGMMGLLRAPSANGPYNFASGDTRPLREFVIEMKEILESGSDLLFGAIPYPPTGMVSLRPIINKLRNEIGWRPRIRFREGIEELASSLGWTHPAMPEKSAERARGSRND